jgi:hypothetical protein
MALFTEAEAREVLAGLLPVLDEIVAVRADVVELSPPSTVGRRPPSAGCRRPRPRRPASTS